MKRTIRIDDHLFAEVKKLAEHTGRTPTAIVEKILRQALARRKQPKSRRKVKLTTFCGKGLGGGIDLDDSAALLNRMERLDASD